MDETKIDQTADLLRVIAHPTRLKILLLLTSQGPRHVTSIQEQLQLGQAFLSHHLMKLRNKGILISQRKGKEMYYEVNSSLLKELIRLVSERVEQESMMTNLVVALERTS